MYSQRMKNVWDKNIRACLVLAWKEFCLPFHYRKSGCPGGRDFVWLSTFMALILTLMFLLLGSREGMLNRFVDVFLGNVKDYGVPISVTNNLLSAGGINAIDSSVLQAVNELPHITIFPYRPLEAALHPLIKLADDKIWQNRQENGSKIGPDFDGRAVYPEDPLWGETGDLHTFPLEIIASRSAFRKYFDFEAYRESLQQELPEQLFQELPVHVDFAAKSPFKQIWLKVTLGLEEELYPFRVRWVTRFPVVDRLAYLFPLSTYQVLKAAHDFPELRYFPEAQGPVNMRIQEISIEKNQESTKNGKDIALREFAEKTGGTLRNYRGDFLISFNRPLAAFRLDAYAQQYGISYWPMDTIPSDPIAFQQGILSLPCKRVPPETLQELDEACNAESVHALQLDVTSGGQGFHRAQVYVADRTFLAAAVERLLQIKQQALSIHPSYQDALNRFSFLSKVLNVIEKPFTWFVGVFLLSFMAIQLATLIGHHRHRYGLLLVKGMEWWQIYCMLLTQLAMALGLGLIAALGIITAARRFLQAAIVVVAEEYAETVSLADVDLLPLTWGDYLPATALVLLLAWGLATLMLYMMPLRQRTHPAMLLH
ncbi:hypothetical protein CSB45_02875 [candidate division KSB3 bacterium]|uniref:Uncharacterized protein n=1 Tax=candidate division KSB3 bacterium TaxID=2044937 RepID=A0A2G6E8Y2_9BACT|nr:MAG: hypothetical protein CSB45_02875 [candidate division KSB3 bacterium]PIE29018.1 MAG: hypothetical protein CSA57_11205 [candidate division KSB3 bacterium]